MSERSSFDHSHHVRHSHESEGRGRWALPVQGGEDGRSQSSSAPRCSSKFPVESRCAPVCRVSAIAASQIKKLVRKSAGFISNKRATFADKRRCGKRRWGRELVRKSARFISNERASFADKKALRQEALRQEALRPRACPQICPVHSDERPLRTR